MQRAIILTLLIILSSLYVVGAIPNPASTYCINQGYKWSYNSTGAYCIFNDNQSCGEWAFYDGTCGQEYVRQIPCKNLGEHLGPKEECCDGLSAMSSPTSLFPKPNHSGAGLSSISSTNGLCAMTVGEYPICGQCGNNICDSKYENSCNCPNDCKTQSNSNPNYTLIDSNDVCENHRYGDCPSGCEKVCTSSNCNEFACTNDCGGPGSCITAGKPTPQPITPKKCQDYSPSDCPVGCVVKTTPGCEPCKQGEICSLNACAIQCVSITENNTLVNKTSNSSNKICEKYSLTECPLDKCIQVEVCPNQTCNGKICAKSRACYLECKTPGSIDINLSTNNKMYIIPNETSGGIKMESNGTQVCLGCIFKDKCYPSGYRISNKYCSDTTTLESQLAFKKPCANNSQCLSNSCVSGECTNPGLATKIANWFRNLFRAHPDRK